MMRLEVRPFLLLLSLALAACAAEGPREGSAPGAGAVAQAVPGRIFIGTGGVTGVYYPAGGAICRLVNEARARHGITCVVESTDGSIANIEGIRTGDLGMALVQSDVQFEAYEGVGPFAAAGAFPELRSVFSLHAEPFTVVARRDAGIATIDDLMGKRVNIGNPGSGQRATMDVLMAAKGWTMADFARVLELPSAEQAQALAGGQADAIVFTVGHPSNAIYEASKSVDARIVPVSGATVDQLLADHPYYARALIPGGFYYGNDADVASFGVRATLVATADTPDEVVYQVVRSVFTQFDRLAELHPALARLDRQEMVKAALSAPLHPGAERYYREAGLL